jgi:hypothetical protein
VAFAARELQRKVTGIRIFTMKTKVRFITNVSGQFDAGRRISSWLSPNNSGVEGRIWQSVAVLIVLVLCAWVLYSQ